MNQGYDFVINYYTTSNRSLYSKNKTISNSAINAPIMEKIRQMSIDARKAGFIRQDCDINQFIYDLTIIEKGVIFDWCVCEGSYDLTEEVSRIMDNYMRRTIVTEKYIMAFE